MPCFFVYAVRMMRFVKEEPARTETEFRIKEDKKIVRPANEGFHVEQKRQKRGLDCW